MQQLRQYTFIRQYCYFLLLPALVLFLACPVKTMSLPAHDSISRSAAPRSAVLIQIKIHTRVNPCLARLCHYFSHLRSILSSTNFGGLASLMDRPISDVQNVRLYPFRLARGRHAAQGDRLRRGISSSADAFFLAETTSRSLMAV
jgi:hypothetical protein